MRQELSPKSDADATSVRELTQDDALCLPEVHAHPLVYHATLSRHYCDICGMPIRRGGAWRCKLCDFELEMAFFVGQ